MMVKIQVNGKEIEYDAYTEFSRYSDKEWFEIHKALAEENYEALAAQYCGDEKIINVIGHLADMEARYEALLELLPQSSYSKAGTHPKWVVDAVRLNTFDKGITQDDIATFVENNDSLDGQIMDLKNYFGLDSQYYEERKVIQNIAKDWNDSIRNQ